MQILMKRHKAVSAAMGMIVAVSLVFSQQVFASKAVGKFVALGTTPVTQAWKNDRNADTHIVWSMDSTTGLILGCGSATGYCITVSGSGPRVKHPVSVGTYVGLGITPVTTAWKKDRPADEHIIFSMSSADGVILSCGDATGYCIGVSGSGPRK